MIDHRHWSRSGSRSGSRSMVGVGVSSQWHVALAIWRENNDCRSRDKNGGNFIRLSGVCRSSWIPKLAILLKSNREAQRKSYCLTFSKVLDWRSTAVYSLQNLPVNVQPHFFLLLLSSKFLRSRPRAAIIVHHAKNEKWHCAAAGHRLSTLAAPIEKWPWTTWKFR